MDWQTPGTPIAFVSINVPANCVRKLCPQNRPPGARERIMATFDNAFDPARPLARSGCSCGQHAGRMEHDYYAQRQLQLAQAGASEEKRYEGVVASAVMRAVFP